MQAACKWKQASFSDAERNTGRKKKELKSVHKTLQGKKDLGKAREE